MFGLQGFLKTYQFSDMHIQEILENIVIRHDVSGRYPTSAPDYPEEEVILRAAHKPLDEAEHILRQWFPSTPIDSSDIEMTGDQQDEDEDEEEELDDNSDVEAMDMAQWTTEHQGESILYYNLIFQGIFMIFDAYFAIFCNVLAIFVE